MVEYKINQGYGVTDFSKSSGFYKNNFHSGIDIVPSNGIVQAFVGGTVKYVGDKKDGFGGTVLIQGNDGKTYRYSHLRGFNVNTGDTVGTGTPLGLMGGASTDPMHGTSTGRHEHFGVYNPDGSSNNPLPYLQGQMPETTSQGFAPMSRDQFKQKFLSDPQFRQTVTSFKPTSSTVQSSISSQGVPTREEFRQKFLADAQFRQSVMSLKK